MSSYPLGFFAKTSVDKKKIKKLLDKRLIFLGIFKILLLFKIFFTFLGLFGIFVSTLIIFFYVEKPLDDPNISEAELKYILENTNYTTTVDVSK